MDDIKIKNCWGEIESGDILYIRKGFIRDFPNFTFKNWEFRKAKVVHVETWKEKYSPHYTNMIILFNNPFSLFDDDYKQVEYLSLSLMRLYNEGKYDTQMKTIYAGGKEDFIDKYEIDITPTRFKNDIQDIKGIYENRIRGFNNTIADLDKCLNK